MLRPGWRRGAEPDPCLGRLPGIRYACCGHGSSFDAYLVFEDDCTIVREEAAHQAQIALGGNPHPLQVSVPVLAWVPGSILPAENPFPLFLDPSVLFDAVGTV